MNVRQILILLSVVLFAIAAFISFSDTPDIDNILGAISLGLAIFAASWVAPADRRLG